MNILGKMGFGLVGAVLLGSALSAAVSPSPSITPTYTPTPRVEAARDIQATATVTPFATPTTTATPTVAPTPTQVISTPTATPVSKIPTQAPLSNDNYYTNTAGNQVHSPAYSNTVPIGASAQCGDGTYSFSQSRRGTCSHHGGVASWL